MPSDDALEAMAAPPSQTGASVVSDLPDRPPRSVFGWLTRVKELNILIALIVLCTLLAFLSPVFFTPENLLGVARAFSLTAIAAIGQTMVIITGGIDLSAGSIIGLSSLSAGLLLVNGWPRWRQFSAGSPSERPSVSAMGCSSHGLDFRLSSPRWAH
jgi:ribose/xylose/arabinose/galactoside ABC-type transport system permease subunit